MARVSGQPGKTRMLNVYAVDQWPGSGSGPDPRPAPTCHLLDLPGYGYARASKSERAGFRRLLAGVLRRPRLAGVVWLLDIRHDPSRDDQAMHEALAATGVPVLAALTKGDKLPRGQRARRRAALRQTLALADDQLVVTSARTRDGIAELRAAVAALARSERENDHAATA